MSKFVLIFALIFTYASAEDKEEFPFIGITVSTQSLSIDAAEDQSVTAFGLQYGKQTVDWRTMFSLNFAKNGYKTLDMEIDKILLDNVFGMAEFRPYLGFSAGMIKYEDDALQDDSGYYYGANLGLLVYATDNIDTDISYHYYKVKGIEGLDSSKGASLSLHYFY